MNNDPSAPYSSTANVLSVPELLEACRLLAEMRKIHDKSGIESMLDIWFDKVHAYAVEEKFSLLARLAFLMPCADLELAYRYRHISIGYLSALVPIRVKFHGSWLALWDRVADVLHKMGRDPERCLPVRS